MSEGSPKPIDPRVPRFNQACIAVVLLVAFVGNWPLIVPGIAVVLLSGALLGPRFGPFLAFFVTAVKPRLAPPVELEDPRLPASPPPSVRWSWPPPLPPSWPTRSISDGSWP